MRNLMLLLALCVVFSCKQKTATKSSKLSGKYAVVGFKVKTDMKKDGGRLIAATDGESYAFNFTSENSVLLNPKLGKEYFSDSVFKYRVTDTVLFLSDKNSEHAIRYRRDGEILNLYINTNGIDTLQIMPVKQAGLN